MKVVTVIPAYNNADIVGAVVRPFSDRGVPVIVIDDGSRDDTATVARDAGATVIRFPANRGKMTAVRTGFRKAIALGATTIVTVDGDGQHDPAEAAALIEYRERSGFDMVVGNRLAEKNGMPWIRYLTNRFMSAMISFLGRQRIRDTQCGFRIIDVRVLKNVQLRTERFEGESELILEAARNGFRIGQAPIKTIYRKNGHSWIRPINDTARWFKFITKYI